jgi:hypothetical protein
VRQSVYQRSCATWERTEAVELHRHVFGYQTRKEGIRSAAFDTGSQHTNSSPIRSLRFCVKNPMPDAVKVGLDFQGVFSSHGKQKATISHQLCRKRRRLETPVTNGFRPVTEIRRRPTDQARVLQKSKLTQCLGRREFGAILWAGPLTVEAETGCSCILLHLLLHGALASLRPVPEWLS